jgi:hypothetical protein
VGVIVARADGIGGHAQQLVLRGPAVGAERHQPHHLEPILGQRAGLVEAHRVDPAERLEHARAAYDGPAPGEPARGGLLCDRRDERQPLRHGGDRHRDARSDRLPQRTPPQHTEPGHGGAFGEGQRQHRPGELAEPRLYSGRGRGRTGCGRCATRLRRVADCHHDGASRTGDHRGAVEEHAGAIGDVRSGCGRR